MVVCGPFRSCGELEAFLRHSLPLVTRNCIAIVTPIADAVACSSTRSSGEMAQVKRKRGWRTWTPRRRRGLAPLVGVMALVAQLILAPLHPTVASPGSAELAELAALTGQQFVSCEHSTGDQSVPDHSDCDSLCCQLSHSLAVVLPPSPSSSGPLFQQAAQLSLPATLSICVSRHGSVPLPRGPPQTA